MVKTVASKSKTEATEMECQIWLAKERERDMYKNMDLIILIYA